MKSQIKSTIVILLAVCFLMSVTVAVVSAKELPDIAGKKADKPADKAGKMAEKKMKGFSIDIEKATLKNNNFRKVLYESF